jgi:hypothetical protein
MREVDFRVNRHAKEATREVSMTVADEWQNGCKSFRDDHHREERRMVKTGGRVCLIAVISP